MATILESLRRKVKSYGDRGALQIFRMPLGYSGGIPGAVAEAAAPTGMGGLSKRAASAGERAASVLRTRGSGKAMSASPISKAAQKAPAAQARLTVPTTGAFWASGGVRRLIQGGSLGQNISLGVQNSLASNFALHSVNARYQGASGLTGGGTAPLRAIPAPTGGGTAMLGAASQNGPLQAALTGTVAAMGAVSGDGSAYRDFAAASSRQGTGSSAVVQVEMVNHNAVSSELDLDRVVSYLTDKVAEGLQTAAETVHW